MRQNDCWDTYQLWHLLDGDLGEQLYLDDLPDQAQHQVLLVLLSRLDQVRGVNVHDLAANGAGRVDDDVLVLNGLPWIQLLAGRREVEGALVHSVVLRQVDELAATKQNAV